MPDVAPAIDAPWSKDRLPVNVCVGQNSVVTGPQAFKRFSSALEEGLIVGGHCTMDDVQFAIGPAGHVRIGDYCYFTNVVLLCECEVRVGNYVMIGWNTTITDTDFHPVDPAQRVVDARACSPLGRGQHRPPIVQQPVVIEDDVWIGPSVTILKGVTIGAGAFIEPGSLVTHDIPPQSRVMGNPARVIDESV